MATLTSPFLFWPKDLNCQNWVFKLTFMKYSNGIQKFTVDFIKVEYLLGIELCPPLLPLKSFSPSHFIMPSAGEFNKGFLKENIVSPPYPQVSTYTDSTIQQTANIRKKKSRTQICPMLATIYIVYIYINFYIVLIFVLMFIMCHNIYDVLIFTLYL